MISTEHYVIMLELFDITGILFIEEICRLIDTEITIFTNFQLRNIQNFLCDIFIYYIFGAYLKSRTITNSTIFVDIE